MSPQRRRFTVQAGVTAAAYLVVLLLVHSQLLEAQATGNTPAFLAFVSSGLPQQTTFTISNPGITPFTFTASYQPIPVVGSALPLANVSYIRKPAAGNSVGGTIVPGGAVSIPIQVNPAGLGTGVYSGQLLINNQDPGSTLQSSLPLVVYIGPQAGTGLGLMWPVNASAGPPAAAAYPVSIRVAPAFALSAANPIPNPTPIMIAGLNTVGVAVNPPVASASLAGVSFTNVGQSKGGTLSGCSSTGTMNTLGGITPGPPCIWGLWVDSAALTAANPPSVVACNGPGETGTITFSAAPGSNQFTSLVVPVAVCIGSAPAVSVTQAVTFPNPLFGASPGAALPLPTNLPASFPQSFVDMALPPAGVTLMAPAGTSTNVCQVLDIHTNGGILPVVKIPAVAASWLTLESAEFLAETIPSFANTGTVVALAPVPGVAPNAAGPALIGSGMQLFQVCAHTSQLPKVAGTYSVGVNVQVTGGDSIAFPVTLVNTAATVGLTPESSQMAVFRNTTSGPNTGLGQWWFAGNSNKFDANTKGPRWFGLNGDTAITGDWDGSGISKIGVFRCPASGVCQWYIDLNNNGQWDGTDGGDAIWNFGLPGDLPVVGDWTGDGVSKIGVVRCPASGVCTWYLDIGNRHTYDPNTVGTYLFGLAGDSPVVGPFTGNGFPVDRIGVMRCAAVGVCSWLVDTVGQTMLSTSVPTLVPATATYTFGLLGDQPLVGNWLNFAIKQIGVFRSSPDGFGRWWSDINFDHVFTVGVDSIFTFGLNGDQAVTGLWSLP